MQNRSLPRRKFLGGLAIGGAGLLLSGCGARLPIGPEDDQEQAAKLAGTAITPAARRTIPVSWAVPCLVSGAASALQALKATGHQYGPAPNSVLVRTIDGLAGDWVFAVDNQMPDDYWITGIGAVPITSPQIAQLVLPRVRRGQLKVVTTNDKGSLPSGSVTPETVYAPTLNSGQLLFTWLCVGTWRQA